MATPWEFKSPHPHRYPSRILMDTGGLYVLPTDKTLVLIENEMRCNASELGVLWLSVVSSSSEVAGLGWALVG